VPTISSAVRSTADVGRSRERTRQRRLARIAMALVPLAAWLWYRLLTGNPVGAPSIPAVDPLYLMAGLFFVVLIVVLLGTTVVAGFRDVRLDLDAAVVGSAETTGATLFRSWVLPFEVLSVLLLAALVGAIVLSRRGER
jgi:hypothetical protein